jgi:NAD(P) transhydrogenase
LRNDEAERKGSEEPDIETRTYDLIVIGSGPGGEKGAAQAAYFGKKVALIERASRLGGAVANTGVPGKAMRETALYLSGFHGRDLHGLRLSYDGTITVDAFMRRGRAVREALSGWVGTNLDRHHVDVHRGVASFVDAHTVQVASEDGHALLHGQIVLIATGSRPLRPATIPFEDPRVYDSDTILEMTRLPRALTIIGGGTIGCEYACLFKVLGLDHVRVINTGDRLLPFADAEIATMLQEAMASIGVEFLMPQHVAAVDRRDGLTVVLQDGRRLEAEAVLVTLGRRSNVEGLGLDRAGVRLNAHGQLEVNERFQTNVPHIYAAGDVIGGLALSSTAMEQARMAMVNAFELKYKAGIARHLPVGVWTIPELSMVGETEESLRAKRRPYVVGRCRYQDNPRGALIGERWGLLKLLFSLPGEQLLGAHMIGENACELIASGLVGMTMGATTATFIDTCFNYPSLSDLYKYATYDAMGNFQRGDCYRG